MVRYPNVRLCSLDKPPLAAQLSSVALKLWDVTREYCLSTPCVRKMSRIHSPACELDNGMLPNLPDVRTTGMLGSCLLKSGRFRLFLNDKSCSNQGQVVMPGTGATIGKKVVFLATLVLVLVTKELSS